ncbi:hypothetical protein [Ferrovibrio xuzhouensis]|uniref:Uncharacterized protein n=1 Tax=Ferrovibrio xuzhouensis TaxID=1576914 RepID=A0ABV7VLN2_9PROT
MFHISRSAIVIAILVGLWTPGPARADALGDLNDIFKTSYKAAAEAKRQDLLSTAPVFVNRFGTIEFYKPGTLEPKRFKMAEGIYNDAKTVAHIPAALFTHFTAAGPVGSGREISGNEIEWLGTYLGKLESSKAALLEKAYPEIQDIPEYGEGNYDSLVRIPQLTMIDGTIALVDQLLTSRKLTPQWLNDLKATTEDGIKASLTAAATSQLTQFHAQMIKWRNENKTLEWHEAVVVIIGIHQARRKYLQRQFFDKLLYDDPELEDHVVFAETLTPFAPPQGGRAPGPVQDAQLLLAKVMLDKDLSSYLFGNRYRLQWDLLGAQPAGIMSSWPQFLPQ